MNAVSHSRRGFLTGLLASAALPFNVPVMASEPVSDSSFAAALADLKLLRRFNEIELQDYIYRQILRAWINDGELLLRRDGTPISADRVRWENAKSMLIVSPEVTA